MRAVIPFIAGATEVGNPLADVVEDLQAQLSAAQALAAEFEHKSLELGAELAVMERKQKNQVCRNGCHMSLRILNFSNVSLVIHSRKFHTSRL